MNSPRMTPTFDSASRLMRAREGRQLGLAAKALAICTLLLGLSPFISWASEPVNINLDVSGNRDDSVGDEIIECRTR